MSKSPLKTLSRIQKLALDEQRKLLIPLLEKEDSLLNLLQQLDENFTKEKEFAMQNNCCADFGLYAKVYLQKKKELLHELELIQTEIAKIRDIITDMFKEQKTYEIVDSEREKKRLKKQEISEQKMLDEIGTNTYIKKHQET